MPRDARVAVFCLFLAFVTTSTALGRSPLPGSLAQGPGLFGQAAASLMWLGAVATGIGIVWTDRLDGLVIEQTGSLILAVGSLLYAIALTQVLGWPWVNIFGFGLACAVVAGFGLQWWLIGRYRRKLIRRYRDYPDPRPWESKLDREARQKAEGESE